MDKSDFIVTENCECIVTYEGNVFCDGIMCDACFDEDTACAGCPMTMCFKTYNYVQEDIKKNGSN